MKTIELKAVKGLRNDISLERFKPGDLSTATNIDIDETGKIFRRFGVVGPFPGTANAHSLFSPDGVRAYVCFGDALYYIPQGGVYELVTPIDGKRVSYAAVNGDTYWSDGIRSGVLRGGEHQQWGIDPPQPPAVQTLATGGFKGGTYLFSATYVRESGEESGAAPYGSVEVKDGEGLRFFVSPAGDPTVAKVRIYVSARNGELPYLAATINATQEVVDVLSPPQPGLHVRTHFLHPAPAGQLVRHAFGRMWVARGEVLWYSLPQSYSLFKPAENFIVLKDYIRTFMAVADGIFVGTDSETIFLSGTDPANMRVVPKANYGTIQGTEIFVPPHQFLKEDSTEPVAVWLSKKGLCAGKSGGEFQSLTGGRFIPPPEPNVGAGLLKVRSGTPQFVVSTFKE